MKFNRLLRWMTTRKNYYLLDIRICSLRIYDRVRDTKKDFNDFMSFIKIKRCNIIKVQTQMNELKYYGIEISRLILQNFYPNIQIVLQKRL